MNEFILVIAVLLTESSYALDIEQPATAVPDTAQFWFGAETAWRIRTYAVDHDIHVYSVGRRDDKSSLTPGEAEMHLRKHYADVLAGVHVLTFKDPGNVLEVLRVLSAHGLHGKLEVAPAGFAFYNPDASKYKTQSQPR